eukprot:5143763-Pyramimonas_sp.AAC.1
MEGRSAGTSAGGVALALTMAGAGSAVGRAGTRRAKPMGLTVRPNMGTSRGGRGRQAIAHRRARRRVAAVVLEPRQRARRHRGTPRPRRSRRAIAHRRARRRVAAVAWEPRQQ